MCLSMLSVPVIGAWLMFNLPMVGPASTRPEACWLLSTNFDVLLLHEVWSNSRACLLPFVLLLLRDSVSNWVDLISSSLSRGCGGPLSASSISAERCGGKPLELPSECPNGLFYERIVCFIFCSFLDVSIKVESRCLKNTGGTSSCHVVRPDEGVSYKFLRFLVEAANVASIFIFGDAADGFSVFIVKFIC